jgi:uncharacterized damage-inducible protein DinB
MRKLLAFIDIATEFAMSTILKSLMRYQSWANGAFFDALAAMDRDRNVIEFHQSMRLMNHIHIVADIFAAHLAGRAHGHPSDNSDEIPPLPDLRRAAASTDQWYLDYVHDIEPAALAEKIAFSFTDGDRGYMSRAEMITHAALHGSYHRGEAGRILMQSGIEAPWDTFAVFIHEDQPERRRQGTPELAFP